MKDDIALHIAAAVIVITLFFFLYCAPRHGMVGSVKEVTLMVERCSGGKVVIQYGHRKMWEVDPETNQLLTCKTKGRI